MFSPRNVTAVQLLSPSALTAFPRFVTAAQVFGVNGAGCTICTIICCSVRERTNRPPGPPRAMNTKHEKRLSTAAS